MVKLLNVIYRIFLRLKGINVGADVKLWPFISISKGYLNGKKGSVSIGANSELTRGVILKAYGGSINVGANTFLGEYVTIYGHGGITIGNNTLIAMHSCIISANHTITSKNELIRDKPDILLPVTIGDDVWIGAGVKILGGVAIGNGCVVGAGAVVTKNLPPYAIAMGIPVEIKGYRNE